jgi:hypothetical protein
MPSCGSIVTQNWASEKLGWQTVSPLSLQLQPKKKYQNSQQNWCIFGRGAPGYSFWTQTFIFSRCKDETLQPSIHHVVALSVVSLCLISLLAVCPCSIHPRSETESWQKCIWQNTVPWSTPCDLELMLFMNTTHWDRTRINVVLYNRNQLCCLHANYSPYFANQRKLIPVMAQTRKTWLEFLEFNLLYSLVIDDDVKLSLHLILS